MESILLSYNDIKSVNIGDYVQSLAARQYFNSDEFHLHNRDELALYNGKPAKAILNGWFTYKPQNWPPADSIKPLFVAFHINDLCKAELLGDASLNYFKKYQPIGCRDYGTVELLKEKGVDAYFSGCLTTTLSLQYKNENIRGNDIYIVDPLAYMPNGNGIYEILKSLLNFIIYFKSVNKILKNLRLNNSFSIKLSKIGITRLLLIPNWYLLLRNIVENDVLERAHFITQFHENDEYKTDELRFNRASELLKKYASAKYIITSRIHCALPCLSLGTPVVFIRNMSEVEKSTCRFKGIENLFNEIRVKGNRVIDNFNSKKLNIDSDFSNSDEYLQYSAQLIKKCRQFFI